MPRPKVYKEYFPSCIERLFGSGKPRRIKARCFVPYTQQEHNTDVYLGPSKDAPNIDLNMTVCKDKYGNLTCSPDGDPRGNYGPCQEMCYDDPCAASPCGPCSPCGNPRLDCGCSCRCSELCSRSSICRCSETCSTSSSGSSTRKTTSRTKSICRCGKPKILVLDKDGRYKPLAEECVKPRTPKRSFKKSKSKSDGTWSPKPQLIVKERKVEVLEPTEDEVSKSLTADCGLEVSTKEKSKNGVILGYVMYDPESEDKRPYVTTMDGKRITQEPKL